MLTHKIGLSAKEHDDFVIASSQTNLLQSSKWAKIKDNWGNERIGFYRDNTLVAAASILIQPLPLGFTLLYIPRGPIMDYQDKELIDYVFKTLKAFGKTKRALFIKFDPSLFLKANLVGEEVEDNKETLAIIDQLVAAGAEWTGRTEDIAENIQPRFQANIYKENFSYDQLHKKAKQSIRTARNKGLNIVFGGTELVDDFAGLMAKTEDRKGISLRNKDYYEKLLTTYGDDAYITMARLDLVARHDKLSAEYEKALKQKEGFNENTHKNKVNENARTIERLEKEIHFLKEKMDQGLTDVPVAATLSLNYGDTSENIYAGMDEDYKAYQAPMLTWFETAEHAFEMGARWQNMGGIENNLDGGLYHFKSKLNPTIEEFAGEFNLPVNKLLYRLSNTAYALRKKLRSKH